MIEFILDSHAFQFLVVILTIPFWRPVFRIIWAELFRVADIEDVWPPVRRSGAQRHDLQRRTIDFGSAQHTSPILWEMSEDETWSKRRMSNPSWDTGRHGGAGERRGEPASLADRVAENANRPDVGGFGRRSV